MGKKDQYIAFNVEQENFKNNFLRHFLVGNTSFISAHKCMIIYGASGVGKTFMVNKMLSEIKDEIDNCCYFAMNNKQNEIIDFYSQKRQSIFFKIVNLLQNIKISPTASIGIGGSSLDFTLDYQKEKNEIIAEVASTVKIIIIDDFTPQKTTIIQFLEELISKTKDQTRILFVVNEQNLEDVECFLQRLRLLTNRTELMDPFRWEAKKNHI